jgi:hypothetical protein
MAMLSKQDHGRSQVAGSTREIQDFGHYCLEWFIKIDKYLNMRLGDEIKGLQVGYHQMGMSGRGYKDIRGSVVVALTYVD